MFREDPEFQPVHGLLMTVETFEDLIDHEDPYHYEMIGNVAYNMAPPSPEHDKIAFNIRRLLTEQLGKSGPCRAFQERRVAIPGKNPSVQPDIVVTCDISDWNKKQRGDRNRFYSPLIVVEVLSPSTEAYDRGEKFARYQLCPTLEVYILVSQDEQHVEVYRKSESWRQERFSTGQTIQLDQLDLELPLDEVYDDIF